MRIGKREYNVITFDNSRPTRPWPLCDAIGHLGKIRQNLGEVPDDSGGRRDAYRHSGLLDEINATYDQRFIRLEQAKEFMEKRVAEERAAALRLGAQVGAELAAERARQ